MSGADAATGAWLAHIAPDQQLAAASATHAALWSWGLGWAAVVLVSILTLKSGLLPRFSRAVHRPWLAGAALAAAFAGLLLIVTAPFALVRGEPPAELIGTDALAILAAAVIAPVLFAVARLRPKSWWALCGPAAAVLVFAWGWGPYLAGGPPLPPAPEGPVKAALAQLIARTHLPATTIELAPASGFDADVTGGLGHARISVTRDALSAPPAEVEAYVGHLMGHYVHRDVMSLSLLLGALVFAGAAAIAGGFAPLARLLGAKGLDHPSDPAGLPVVAIILSCVVAAGTPVLAGFGRAVNVQADQYALDQAREPDGLAAVLIRTWDHKAIQPSAAEEALFYGHPPLASRIRHAMAWKQAAER